MNKFKLLVSFLIGLCLIVFLVSPVSAGEQFNEALKSGEMNLESFIAGKKIISRDGKGTSGVLPAMINGLTGHLVGVWDLETGELVGQGGVLQGLGRLANVFYVSKPISSIAYFRDFRDNLNVVKPAHAQTEGFNFLSPIINIWRVVRNAAYLFIVVIFIVIGFMIMFRTKMNPQIIVSVQNAIPQIVIGLILITFSYAICGLAVDLIYVGNGLLKAVFTSAPTGFEPAIDPWRDASGFDILQLLFDWEGAGQIQRQNRLGIDVPPLIWAIGSGILTGIPNLLRGNLTEIMLLVIAFVIVSTIFKIFFALLQRYVTIIILTIFSPFAILWGILPGQKDTLSKFFLQLFASSLTFPAILLFVNLAEYISAGQLPKAFEALPPFQLGVAGGSDLTKTLASIVGLGVLMAASKIPDAIEEALKVSRGGAGGVGMELSSAIKKLPLIGSFIG